MGSLIYSGAEFVFDDRVLAHIRVVVTRKLRRREGFYLNWSRPVAAGSGRYSIWISPHVPVVFDFSQNVAFDIDADWIHEMWRTANTLDGVQVIERTARTPPA